MEKALKYLDRRIFHDFLFEFTISIRKLRFSSLAYDPALSVTAQKSITGFSQFAYLGKKQVFQLVVFRLGRKTVQHKEKSHLGCFSQLFSLLLYLKVWGLGENNLSREVKVQIDLTTVLPKTVLKRDMDFLFFSIGKLTIYIGQPRQNPNFFFLSVASKFCCFTDQTKLCPVDFWNTEEAPKAWQDSFLLFQQLLGLKKKRTLENALLEKIW